MVDVVEREQVGEPLARPVQQRTLSPHLGGEGGCIADAALEAGVGRTFPHRRRVWSPALAVGPVYAVAVGPVNAVASVPSTPSASVPSTPSTPSASVPSTPSTPSASVPSTPSASVPSTAVGIVLLGRGNPACHGPDVLIAQRRVFIAHLALLESDPPLRLTVRRRDPVGGGRTRPAGTAHPPPDRHRQSCCRERSSTGRWPVGQAQPSVGERGTVAPGAALDTLTVESVGQVVWAPPFHVEGDERGAVSPAGGP